MKRLIILMAMLANPASADFGQALMIIVKANVALTISRPCILHG